VRPVREQREVRHRIRGRLVARDEPGAVRQRDHRRQPHDESGGRLRRARLVPSAAVAAARQRRDGGDQRERRKAGERGAHGRARQFDPAPAAPRGAEAGGREELLLQIALEVLARGERRQPEPPARALVDLPAALGTRDQPARDPVEPLRRGAVLRVEAMRALECGGERLGAHPGLHLRVVEAAGEVVEQPADVTAVEDGERIRLAVEAREDRLVVHARTQCRRWKPSPEGLAQRT
jgi:hypothetical protein